MPIFKKSIFEQIRQWVVDHQDDIILLIGVILISLLSFAMGYIVAKQQEKEPIKIEKFQAPSTKFQISSNDQNLNSQNSFGHSVIGIWNLFGIWNL
ncbi:MAG: hypothetical protein ACE5J0_00360 [Candidatus Paceibacterales bacterium]